MQETTIRRLFLYRHGKYEKKFAKQFTKAIRNQIRSLDPYDLPTQELESVYRKMYLHVTKREGAITWNLHYPGQRIKTKDFTNELASVSAPQDEEELQTFWENLLYGYLDAYIQTRLLNVTATTQKEMIGIIEEGRETGLSDKEIRNKLLAHSRVQELRGNTISRTETTNAMNKAQILALRSSGDKWIKAWYAIKDDRTRDAHLFTSPKEFIPIEQPFLVGGEYLGYPGDITLGATAKNLINCRCSMIFKKVGQTVGFRPKR